MKLFPSGKIPGSFSEASYLREETQNTSYYNMPCPHEEASEDHCPGRVMVPKQHSRLVGPDNTVKELIIQIRGNSFDFRTSAEGVFDIDWGDGSYSQGVYKPNALDSTVHVFPGNGEYTVRIKQVSGDFSPVFSGQQNISYVGEIPSYFNLTRIDSSFSGCRNLETVEISRTGHLQNLDRVFSGARDLLYGPHLDISSATTLDSTWENCNSLIRVPPIDFSKYSGELRNTWDGCTSLTEFPYIDTSKVNRFVATWKRCKSIIGFPKIDASSAVEMSAVWLDCDSMENFPGFSNPRLISRTFENCWLSSNRLRHFPPKVFDDWVPDGGSVDDGCFRNSWFNTSLSPLSVENVLNSISASGVLAPATGNEITIYFDDSGDQPSVATAIADLKMKGWDVVLNSVSQ